MLYVFVLMLFFVMRYFFHQLWWNFCILDFTVSRCLTQPFLLPFQVYKIIYKHLKMETETSKPILPTKVPLLLAKQVPKGWYLFILEDDINKVGFPDFRNLYACPSPRLTCCLTRNQKKTVKWMMRAKQIIESYAISENIAAHIMLVHRLERGKKKSMLV